MRTIGLATLLLTTACSRPEPAPADIDGALHYLWDGYEQGEAPLMAEAAANLDAELVRLVEEEGAKMPYDGTQTKLTTEQIADLSFTGEVPDPALTGPFFMANEIGCTTAEVERVFSALNQHELHPGSYDRYERAYTSDADAFYGGELDTLRWDVEIEATYGFPVNYSFVERLQGGLRRIDGGDFGDVVLGRTHLIEPAEDEDDNKSFEQDYQLDMWWERPADEGPRLLHIWAVWRRIDLGSSGDQDSRLVIGTTISNAIGWDEEVTELCEILRETGEVRPPE